ncbi:MAG: hypothetical protein ACFFDW_12195, partial [Candidatus Thorarchaeota archaeon]
GRRSFILMLFKNAFRKHFNKVIEIEPEHPLALDESEKVRNLLARSIQTKNNTNDELVQEEKDLLNNRKSELTDFLNDSQNSIADSIEKILDLINQEATKEAVINRDKIIGAIKSFNDQLMERIESIAKDFTTIDFEEECRELLEKWEHFKEIELKRLQSIE